jgi:hypothetical protein
MAEEANGKEEILFHSLMACTCTLLYKYEYGS